MRGWICSMGNCLLLNIYSIYIYYLVFMDGVPVVVDVAGTNTRHSLAATQQTWTGTWHTNHVNTVRLGQTSSENSGDFSVSLISTGAQQAQVIPVSVSKPMRPQCPTWKNGGWGTLPSEFFWPDGWISCTNIYAIICVWSTEIGIKPKLLNFSMLWLFQ